MFEPARLIFLVAIVAAVGGALLLGDLPWFRRQSMTVRLLPHAGAGTPGNVRKSSFVDDVLTPLATSFGAQLSALAGVHDDLAVRIERGRLPYDVSSFRLRQLAHAGGSSALGLLAVVTIRPPLALTVLLLVGGPLLAFLLLEQQVATAVTKRQKATFAELPLVAEQIAMLLGAGYSLNAALNRVSDRLEGVAADDLRRVCERVLHGLGIRDALREWAQSVDIPELDRLVAVLSLTTETSDLGRLVSDEAEAIRRESQRRLVELIDKRAQMVWVPVTVATLVPGVIFLCIPFFQALQLLSGA